MLGWENGSSVVGACSWGLCSGIVSRVFSRFVFVVVLRALLHRIVWRCVLSLFVAAAAVVGCYCYDDVVDVVDRDAVPAASLVYPPVLRHELVHNLFSCRVRVPRFATSVPRVSSFAAGLATYRRPDATLQ